MRDPKSAEADPSPGSDALHRSHPLPQGERANEIHGAKVIGDRSTNQLFACTKPLIFGLSARGATS